MEQQEGLPILNWTGSNTDPVLPSGTGPEALRALTIGVDTELDGLGNLEGFLDVFSNTGDGKFILGILPNGNSKGT